MAENKFKEIIIYHSATILDALKQMDSSRRRLLIVFNANEKFIGLVSIGDIQRAIINNISLNEPLLGILRKKIQIAHDSEPVEKIRQRMLEQNIECMPVVDDDDNLVNILYWEDIAGRPAERIERRLNIPVIIMAGGEGRRLKPITNILPKALIPLGEKTILEHILDRFYLIGCNEFYISVNYKADMVKYYLRGEQFSIYNIEFFQEEKPLGTAGSLTLIKDKINSPFFLSNCDILIDQELGAIYDFHVENRNKITIVAAMKHLSIPYGTLQTKEDGLLYELTEKPEYNFKINSGLYILEPDVIKEIPENQFFHITDLIDKLIAKQERVGVFPVSEGSWIDIGNWDDYLRNINVK